MTTCAYSHLFSCLYDQQEPVGALGRGTHYSAFRSIQWRSLSGSPSAHGRIHDFAVIWDEDHDERVISVVERLQLAGLMWPVIFVGERKATLTVLLAHELPWMEAADASYIEQVRELASDADGDVWDVQFGTYQRCDSKTARLIEPAQIIADVNADVAAFLRSIDVLWQLGESYRPTFAARAEHRPDRKGALEKLNIRLG